jgi:hypothetical protein
LFRLPGGLFLRPPEEVGNRPKKNITLLFNPYLNAVKLLLQVAIKNNCFD